jgi:hypothetical protein
MPQKDLFTGRSGQLAVMAEFLIRNLNVAIPEVDIGDDIVVVRDDHDEITRVQVKTANATELKKPGTFSAQFRIPLEQLEKGPPRLAYAFAVRRFNRWEEFLIVRRRVLYELWTDYKVGSADGRGYLVLKLTFSMSDVRAKKKLSFQPFRARFDPWPPTDEIPDGVLAADV